MHGIGFVSFGRTEGGRKKINQKLAITDSSGHPWGCETKVCVGGRIAEPRSSEWGRLGGEVGARCRAGDMVGVEPRTGCTGLGDRRSAQVTWHSAFQRLAPFLFF